MEDIKKDFLEVKNIDPKAFITVYSVTEMQYQPKR